VTDEFELIARVFAPLAADGRDGLHAFGLTDDAAVVEGGGRLVVSKDVLVEGVHFFAENAPGDVFRKAVRVNVSDVVAKGAAPVAYLLGLALPRGKGGAWTDGVSEALLEEQERYGIALLGGDTTSHDGPFVLSVTMFGRPLLPCGRIVRRSGAGAGDGLYVTGTIGDAYAGLQLLTSPERFSALPLAEREYLRRRYLLPQPRAAMAAWLAEYAGAAMDVSDGLIADCGRLLRASGKGAVMETDLIPHSHALRACLAQGLIDAADAASGGDDYEILCAVPRERELEALSRLPAGERLTRIGAVEKGEGLLFAGKGREAFKERKSWGKGGYEHLI
jgi:thiamine-monophosphate kinase